MIKHEHKFLSVGGECLIEGCHVIKEEQLPINFAVINDKLALACGWDRILVKEDPFKTGWECSLCDGVGHTKEPCKYCHGTGWKNGNSERGPCPDCTVRGDNLRGTTAERTLKYTPCPQCNGKGALIVVPDDAQRRPHSGIILQTGPRVQYAKIGDHVAYQAFAGTILEWKNCPLLRVMVESEIALFMWSKVDPIGGAIPHKDLVEVGVPQK